MLSRSITKNIPRRIFCAQALTAITLPTMIGCGNASPDVQASLPEDAPSAAVSPEPQVVDVSKKEGKNGGKTLVIYFSHSGNTRVIAQYVHEIVGADLVELKTVKPYPEDYDECVDQAKKEQDDDFRPELKTKIENLADYETIYLGYPNWWGTTPMAVATLLETYDFSGKVIYPFCTHEGSGLGQSTQDIKKWSPKVILKEGLAIRGRSVRSAKGEVETWIKKK